MDPSTVLFALVAIVATLQIPLVIAVASALGRAVGASDLRMRRLYYPSGVLCVLQIIWVLYALLAAVGFTPLGDPLYRVMALVGIIFICGSLFLCFWITLEGVAATGSDAKNHSEGE